MKQTPYVSQYLDDEEHQLIQIIEDDSYNPVSVMTPEMLSEHQKIAHNTINEGSTKVSIHIPNSDLLRVKALALKEGLPYQTLIKSILHKSVSS